MSDFRITTWLCDCFLAINRPPAHVLFTSPSRRSRSSHRQKEIAKDNSDMVSIHAAAHMFVLRQDKKKKKQRKSSLPIPTQQNWGACFIRIKCPSMCGRDLSYSREVPRCTRPWPLACGLLSHKPFFQQIQMPPMRMLQAEYHQVINHSIPAKRVFRHYWRADVLSTRATTASTASSRVTPAVAICVIIAAAVASSSTHQSCTRPAHHFAMTLSHA